MRTSAERNAMNVRKPVDYGTMYMELTAILTQNLSQMDETYAIGKTIGQRPEKGAAVAAAEFMQVNFPDRTGFSPRNVRRMRDFYKVYENDQTLLRLAMKIGWTLNVVIMEAELTRDVCKWYLEQARHRGWTKAELQAALDFEKLLRKGRRFALFRCLFGWAVQHCVFAFPDFLCYNIGTVINAHKVWGSRFVENLAADIKLSFPEMKGYSVRNLKYMAKFAEAYPENEFVQQPVAQIPWGHNVALLDKVADKTERLWYAEQSRKNGWSRNVLVHQIESGLYQRQALAEKISNFELRLPSPQSELAIQTMKDPYIFDFIRKLQVQVGHLHDRT